MVSDGIFILKEVIDELVDTSKSLVSPLMKLNYFSRQVKNQELIDYTTSELEGYGLKDENLPEYRKSIGILEVTLRASGYENSNVVELPVSMLDEPFDEKMKYFEIMQGVGVLEQMMLDRSKEEKPEAFFYRRLPMEMLSIFQPAATKLYRSNVRLDVVKAVQKGNAYTVHEVIYAVRHRLLSFVSEIAEKFGYNIEISSFKKNQEQNNQTINYYMETKITNTGDGNVVNTGDNSSVITTITITKEHRKQLEEFGIEKNKIDELEEILETSDQEKSKLKINLMKWFGEVSAHVTAIGLAHNIPAIADFVGKFF